LDREDIAELFASYGPVSVKRMFSGFGLYAEDVCFALFLRGELFFKADASTIPRFEAEGARPFSYSQIRSGKVVIVNSFWRLPERLYDDADELAEWTRSAVRVAHATRTRKPKSKSGDAAAAKSSVKKPKLKSAKKATETTRRKPKRA
jgi:DNA transformation protein